MRKKKKRDQRQKNLGENFQISLMTIKRLKEKRRACLICDTRIPTGTKKWRKDKTHSPVKQRFCITSRHWQSWTLKFTLVKRVLLNIENRFQVMPPLAKFLVSRVLKSTRCKTLRSSFNGETATSEIKFNDYIIKFICIIWIDIIQEIIIT